MNGRTLCLGDFNSRLYCRFGGVEKFIGNHFIKHEEQTMVGSLNRFFFIRILCNHE